MRNITLTIKAEELKKRLRIKDGEPGTPADESKIVSDVLSRLPKPLPPTPPPDGSYIVQAINNEPIELENQIGVEHIRGLEAEIKALKEGGGRQIYGPGKTKVLLLDLSSQLNGVLKTFALPTNFGIIAVNSSSAPFGAFRPIVDYQSVGRNIVFDPSIDASISLGAGQSLTVTYLR